MMGHPSSTGVLLIELNSKMVIPMKRKKGLAFSKAHDDPLILSLLVLRALVSYISMEDNVPGQRF